MKVNFNTFNPNFNGFVRFDKGTLYSNSHKNPYNEEPVVLNTKNIDSYEPVKNGYGLKLVYREDGKHKILLGSYDIPFYLFDNAIMKAEEKGSSKIRQYPD